MKSTSYLLRSVRCVFYLWTLSLLVADAQPLSFRRYTSSNGLSNNTVYCMVQDQLGYIWVGTDDGLNRFDGYKFEQFKYNPADSQSISNGRVQCLLHGKDKTIWIGTDDGLNAYNPLNGKFTYYKNKSNDPQSLGNNFVSALTEGTDGKIYVGTNAGLSVLNRTNGSFKRLLSDDDQTPAVNALVVDGNGLVWIGTGGQGMMSFDPTTEKITSYTNRPGDANSIASNDIKCLYVDKKNTLWIGTLNNGLDEFNINKKQFRHHDNDPSNPNSLSQSSVFSITQDNDQQLWIGTAGGLNAYNSTTNRFTTYRYIPNNASSLSHNQVWSVFVDKGGTLWVGTAKGLNSYAKSRIKFSTVSVDPSSDATYANNNVYGICEDSRGSVWVGVMGAGLKRLNGTTGNVESSHASAYGSTSGLSSNYIFSIAEDRNGALWIGTGDGLNAFDKNNSFTVYKHDGNDATSLSNNFVRCVYTDSKDRVWVGTRGGGLNRFDNSTKKFTSYRHSDDAKSIGSDNVNCIFEDKSGNLWIGLHGGGLSKFNPDNGTFVTYKSDAQNSKSLSSNYVHTINQDKNGTLWIGTFGAGLNAMSGDNTFTRYTDKDGLSNNTIYGILVDERNTLWLSCGNGISSFEPNNGKPIIRNFDEMDGLQYRYNNGACFETKDGRLLFGGMDGLNIFHPDKINYNPNAPTVVLSNFKVDEHDYDLDTLVSSKRNIELGYGQKFSLEFAGLDFVLPEKNHYEYMLEGVDKTWINAGTRRYASYTNLNNGRYIFHVRAANNDGKWAAQAASISILVHPPFWKTWWFIALCVIALVASVYGFIHTRTRRLKHEKIVLEEKVEQRTTELKEEKDKVETKSKELEKTLQHLKDTQLQLVQSEKMASLGQLTAGIAHEIKNPLNFVNNFAQLSSELVDEIEESQDATERSELMMDLKKNLDKINHHGKRADSIVQSMLQHSRGNTGEKQPTDLNKLCEEYLDLAFHGMRAMIQNFNCSIVKNFDPSLPKVDVVPQEVSRVVLNLLNNAFYAVKEKKDAKVEVNTRKEDGFVIIRVRDNGTGMPDDVKNKIFEPFFTTKPTGEGTGLGLSMTFDIIKAHGGEINVESEAGKFTEFKISLPVNS